MPGHEDISWQVLRQILRDWAGSGVDLAEATPLHGGSINTTLALTSTDGQKVVLKITPHRIDRSYADESAQLRLLAEVGVPTPRVLECRIGTLERPFSYLLMEFVEGVELSTAKAHCDAAAFDALQIELASLALTMHDRTADRFGRVSSGETPTFTRWCDFYHAIFNDIWHEVEKSGHLPVKCRKQVAKIHERLDRLLAHDDKPRLMHWDLWSTNILVKPDADGRWHVAALLDPNCKFGHAEAEIAYLELFHTVTPAFMRAYQAVRRLPNDYHRVRKPIYQMYSLINHVCSFGQEYVKPLMAALERVTPLV